MLKKFVFFFCPLIILPDLCIGPGISYKHSDHISMSNRPISMNSHAHNLLFFTVCSCNGQIVGQPRKRECRQNVQKCRKNVRKMSKNCPEGLQPQFSDIFRTILPIWSMLLFGNPVQCSPITTKCADWANCKLQGSENSTLLVILWRFRFSQARLFPGISSTGPLRFNKITDFYRFCLYIHLSL